MVHAKAAGAFGFFEVLDDITDLTDAKFLSSIGKKTDIMTRISTVGGEKGSADTVRDVRGWSTKFYTEDGNQDFVFNDLPVFFLRDPIKFPSMNRSHKKHPRTNVPDNSMFWDYHVNNPEGMHALIHLFGQRGIPASLRHINGFGVHTYTLTKSDGTFVYIKWHWKPEGGIETLDSETAARLAGTDPDYHVKDMFNAIEQGEYPTWLLYVQVIRPEEVDSAPFDIFDGTFTWPHARYPLRRVGRLTLNRNVRTSAALPGRSQLTLHSPTIISRTLNRPRSRHRTWSRVSARRLTWVSTTNPTYLARIVVEPQTVLQARMFAYPDAARYRLGTNYQQLPSNRAHVTVYNPYERDGRARIDGNYGGDPDYIRSELRPVSLSSRHSVPTHEHWHGKVQVYSTGVTEKDFEQPRMLWTLIQKEGARDQLLGNICATLLDVDESLRDQVYGEYTLGFLMFWYQD